MIAAQDALLLVARVLMATMFFTSARDKFRFDATEVQQGRELYPFRGSADPDGIGGVRCVWVRRATH